MPKVLVTGGTGNVGSQLCAMLREAGYQPCILSRSKRPDADFTVYSYDLASGEIEEGWDQDLEYIVHLAGAGIVDKAWTAQRKKEIVGSRTEILQLLWEKVKEKKVALKALVSASAVGYYGMQTREQPFKEDDAPGEDFVAHTCKAWEEAAFRFEELGIRTAILRIGIVLMKKGGALEKMTQPIKLGFGAALGSGKQFIPWIHIKDLCALFEHCISTETVSGPYNAAAPYPVDNREFTKSSAKVLKKKLWLPPVPGFVLKLTLGDRANLVLKGSPVSVKKILKTGFQFQYPNLEEALSDLLEK